ncbi:MAG: hypothetical protein CFE32_00395 [Alphaproteobacteria bacterium PA3]|nr:MAG: hypothetical protein CFE32_00395 [Alphaproteobacteria bacterium PA3]
MRALTMDEVSFVSGGGTPLKQQAEQAAFDRAMAGARESLADSGLTEGQQAFVLRALGAYLGASGAALALADKKALVKVLGTALAIAGVSLGVAADAIVLFVTPSPAY